jgi:hypothetical protein
MSNSVEIDPARTVTHPTGITQVFATRVEDRAPGEGAIGAFQRGPERGAYSTYAPDGSSLGMYASAPEAFAAIACAHLGETTCHDGAHWFAEGPSGAPHLIRWFSNSGNVTATRVTGMKTVHRGRAESIGEARGEALRMAGLIADGKRG